jgi:hypothetical protein
MRVVNYLGLGLSILFIATGVYADGIAKEPTKAPIAVAPSTTTSAGIGLERATGERLATAVGHYARSRSLLIAAINEFDKGYKVANPDAVLDSKEWRATLIDRAEELQKILDPQPRVTRGGVKFDADSRLLNEAGR